MARTIRITPKDSEELAFLCELFDRLGLEYSVNEKSTTDTNLVREPAEEEVKQGKGLRPNDARDFMNDEFKAVALKTKGVRFDRDEANSR